MLLLNKKAARGILLAAFILYGLSGLTGCSSVSDRQNLAQNLVDQAGYHPQTIPTAFFDLYAATPTRRPTASSLAPLTFVIEGDGYAWVDRRHPTRNPTPKNPVGLRLATGPFYGATYLARPCQYVDDPRCTVLDWTDDRFSSDVLASYMSAIDRLKQGTDTARPVHLVGYSGGAYIALSLAAMRRDIRYVTTVAGLLDPVSWADDHRITRLRGVSSFAALATRSQGTYFTHWCGEKDDVILCAQHEKWRAALPPHVQGFHHWRTIPGATHQTIYRGVVAP